MPIQENEKLNSSKYPPFSEPVCKSCGLHYSEFERSGFLGCPRCYTCFAENLKLMLQKIHGSHKHIGSRPVNLRKRFQSQDLEKLKLQLRTAIEGEAYENAAELRDLIKDLERQLN
jgi:protein arginine kinase activator